jgi:hypothetical protein
MAMKQKVQPFFLDPAANEGGRDGDTTDGEAGVGVLGPRSRDH